PHLRFGRVLAVGGAGEVTSAVATMAAGQSVVAPIATKALALVALAADDHVREPLVGASPAERDVSVNHAFSRQFFDALERGPTGASAFEHPAHEAVDP
ncbi:MAG: hypothetical protein ABIY55_16375, partial [Kofleriaceae bacterium]